MFHPPLSIAPLHQPPDDPRSFVLECLRHAVTSGTIAAATAVDEQHWSFILSYGLRQGILPIVYAQSAQAAAHRAGSRPPECLRRHYLGNAARNLMMAHELTETSRRLADAGVRSLAFKGPALSQLAYGTVAYREFSDLDLLISLQDVDRACAVLSGSGYVYWNKSGVSQRAERRMSYDHSFLRGDVHLELHWRLTPRRIGFAADFDQLWERRVAIPLADSEQVAALSPEDHLLLLCVYGAKHGWPRLGWVADLAGLIVRAPTMDASDVVRQARQRHVVRMLRIGLLLVSRLCPVRLNPAFQALLNGDSTAAALAAGAESRLLCAVPIEPDWRQSLGFQWASRERWRDRVRVFALTESQPVFPIATQVPGWVRTWASAARVVTPSYRDFKRVPLPHWLWSTYYVIRPLRIITGAVRRRCGLSLTSRRRNRP